MIESAATIIEATQRWIERAVIGLGLCPFAKSVHASNLIRYRVSEQRSTVGLLDELADELELLQASDSAQVATTLLIHPYALNDFLDYNDFLNDADDALEALGLTGELQIASFHPHYQFADTAPDAIENYTNRSPYPMLHLLREASITHALEEYPDVEQIPMRNVQTLLDLGHDGWHRLWAAKPAIAK
jgi:hypothetical protein